METVKKFNQLLSEETMRLEKLCKEWQNVLDTTTEQKTTTEDLQDQIRSVVGQTKLLLKEKFQQFRDLVNKYENGHGDVNITPDDLEGFWDLILIQINDVTQKFDVLQKTSKESSNGYHLEINGKVK